MECKKCRNLYFLTNNHQCHLIFDPDCETSDGVISDCEQCKDIKDVKQSFFLANVCNSNMCTSLDSKTGQCKECINGYALVKILG